MYQQIFNVHIAASTGQTVHIAVKSMSSRSVSDVDVKSG